MSRQTRQGWVVGRTHFLNASERSRSRRNPRLRRLRVEHLEDRRLLAGVDVGNNLDVVNGDTSNIAALIANDGGDGISLREAIEAANETDGPDEITFAPSLSGETITLGGTDLEITEALTIDARPLAENVTIDANQVSRIFNITATEGEFTLGGLTLTGGRTTQHNVNGLDNTFSGGAIRSLTTGDLVVEESNISGNDTLGDNARGGAIWAQGDLMLNETSVGDNTTAGTFSSGGAIYAQQGDVTFSNSTVSGNSTRFFGAHGGAIFVRNGALTLTNSTLSNNQTRGFSAFGGAIRAEGSAVTVIESTVTGNSTTHHDNAPGGAIYARGGGGAAFTEITLINSTVSGNSTAGTQSPGGAIRAQGDVTLIESRVSGNRTTRNSSRGGAISASNVTLIETIVSGNTTAGTSSSGGGISAFNVTLDHSTVSGNTTTGFGAQGGGISGIDVTLVHSTVTDNTTTRNEASGGGISAAIVTLAQSTVSGNTTTGNDASGGGIWTESGAVTLTNSTLSGNSTAGTNSHGGGIFVLDTATNPPLTIVNSIVAGNTVAQGAGPDLLPDPDSTLTVNYSLIGTDISLTSGGNNVVTDDPQLGPLANNGGPTRTHALLPGSPAIDAGDPNFEPNDFDPPLVNDQRGDGFDRVANGGSNGFRIDIGAYESQGVPSFPLGDYNRDGVAGIADYVLWRNTDGGMVTPFSGADGNGNGVIDDGDYQLWRDNYGNTIVQVTPVVGNGSAYVVDARTIDIAPTELATDSLIPRSRSVRADDIIDSLTVIPKTDSLLLLAALGESSEDEASAESPFAARSRPANECPTTAPALVVDDPADAGLTAFALDRPVRF